MSQLQPLKVLNEVQLRELILRVDSTTMDCRSSIAELRSRLNQSYDEGVITSKQFRNLVVFMADWYEKCLGTKPDYPWY